MAYLLQIHFMETRKGIITIDERSTYGDAKNRKFFDIQVRIFGQMESSHLFPLLFFISTLGSHWWSPDLLALRSSLTYIT